MTFPGHLVTIRVMDELDPFLVQLILAPISCTTNLNLAFKRRIFITYIWLGEMQTLVHHNINSVLLRDREKGKFEMFYSSQNRYLNFPAAAAETFKGGDPRRGHCS